MPYSLIRKIEIGPVKTGRKAIQSLRKNSPERRKYSLCLQSDHSKTNILPDYPV